MTAHEAYQHARALWPDQIVSASEFQGKSGRHCKITHAPKSASDRLTRFYAPTFEECFAQAEEGGR